MKSRRKKNLPPPARLPSARRLWLFRLTALLLPLALLALVEMGLRLAGSGYDPHFFKRITIGNEDFFVQNEDFSRLFFPQETARTPSPIRFPAQKQPGTFRIFIMGESAAMGDPEPAYGAGRYLEMLLRDKYPGTNFEVINTGITAIDSHVIVPIARECARHEGDLWIVYMGNNEMVGPFGAATVFGRRAAPLPYVRLATALQRTRTGQLITDWARRAGHGKAASSWGGMQMFLANEIPPDSPMKETVYRNFEKNLDDIVRAGVRSGARVMLNTVAVNLRDCPPFGLLVNSNLPPDQRAQFDTAFAEGCQAENQSQFAAADQLFAQAAGLDPQSASLQYHWGRCLLAQSDFTDARGHLQSACDDDPLPFRADTRINALIRGERGKISSGNLLLCDAANELATNNPDGLCGQETFYEHVHFDFAGSYRLARVWAEQIKPLLPPTAREWASQANCEDRLGLSDWNRALVLEHMAGRLQVPPFSGQPGNDQRRENLLARARELRQGMDAADAARTKDNFMKQLGSAPDDWLLHENFALFLQSIGDLPLAVAECRRVHELIPQDFLAFFQMGRMLGEEGQSAEAESALRQAVQLRPALTEGWIELGKVLAAQGKFSEALADYATALKQRPNDDRIFFYTGQALAGMNRHAEAMEHYRTASTLDPTDWEPHFELGGELDAAGQLDAARQEFGEAARLNPGNSRAHFNYGVLLAKQQRYDEAQHEFEETLRIEPGYTTAQKYLVQIEGLKRRAP